MTTRLQEVDTVDRLHIYRTLKDSWIGAHAKGQNTNALGVTVCGNFEEHPFDGIRAEGLMWLLGELHNAYPNARILPHRYMKLSSTACPGVNLIRWLVDNGFSTE
jgi:hypothetical protein